VDISAVRLDRELPLPTYAKPGDAGLDLRASYDYEKYNGQWQYKNTRLGNFGSDFSGEEWARLLYDTA